MNLRLKCSTMHPNYEFLFTKCERLAPRNGRILDYGCGNGKTVEEGVRRNLNVFGVEAFSFGSGPDLKKELEEKGLLNDRILELVDTAIPFPDQHFDMIISNQVFEHVVDLKKALKEIARVLKPGGKLVCLFPSKEVIREGHCGIVFAHWLPYSKLRYRWLLLWRSIGFGRLKRRRTKYEWAQFFNNWLVDHVSYRDIPTIHTEFGKVFDSVTHLENDYVRFRLIRGKHTFFNHIVTLPLIRQVSAWLFTRWGGLVILATKGNS